MANQMWMGVGVAAVGMALVLGVPLSAAQEQGQVSSGTISASTQAENEAEYRLEIAQLRTQVAQLQQQLARTRTQVAQNPSTPSSTEQGVGGSGNAGTSPIGDSNAEVPEGANGVGRATSVGGSGSAGTAPASGDSGFALANVLHTGQVKSVTPRTLVLMGEKGSTTTLSLARDVEVLDKGRPIALGRLEAGTRVKTSAPLATPGNPVIRIEILPTK